MFRSNSCAVLTSFDTTNALTGCCACPPIASANWFVSDAPTMLNAGGTDCDCAAALGAVGVTDGAEPPPKPPATLFDSPTA